MLDIERRRLTLSGSKASEVNAGMKGFAQFYDLTLRNGLTPAQAIERNPALGKLWSNRTRAPVWPTHALLPAGPGT